MTENMQAAISLLRHNLEVVRTSAEQRFRHNLRMEMQEALSLLRIIEKEAKEDAEQ